MKSFQRYVYNLLLLLDQALNTLFAGDPKECCSSRLGRYHGKVRLATIIADVINFVALKVFNQPNHCQISIQPDFDHRNEVLK